MTTTLKQQIEQWINKESKKDKVKYNTYCDSVFTAQDNFKEGANSMLPLLMCAVEALEFDCGNKCNAEYNPCNAREALNTIKQMIEVKL